MGISNKRGGFGDGQGLRGIFSGRRAGLFRPAALRDPAAPAARREKTGNAGFYRCRSFASFSPLGRSMQSSRVMDLNAAAATQ